MTSKENEQKRAFWMLALGFGVTMAILYVAELAKIATLVFSHEVLVTEVTDRRESTAFCEITYRYKFHGNTFIGNQLYRFPETLFVNGMAVGEKIDILVSPTLHDWSLPARLVWLEVLLPMVLVIAAGAIVGKARHELKKFRSVSVQV